MFAGKIFEKECSGALGSALLLILRFHSSTVSGSSPMGHLVPPTSLCLVDWATGKSLKWLQKTTIQVRGKALAAHKGCRLF